MLVLWGEFSVSCYVYMNIMSLQIYDNKGTFFYCHNDMIVWCSDNVCPNVMHDISCDLFTFTKF